MRLGSTDHPPPRSQTQVPTDQASHCPGRDFKTGLAPSVNASPLGRPISKMPQIVPTSTETLPLQWDIKAPPTKKWGLCLHPWDQGWPPDMWAKRSPASGGESAPGPVLNRPCSIPFPALEPSLS